MTPDNLLPYPRRCLKALWHPGTLHAPLRLMFILTAHSVTLTQTSVKLT